ncbi:MAG: alpha/beta fold hydrolase [Vicinamibacterales bacterium]
MPGTDSSVLASTVVTGDAPTRDLVLMHGIYGRGRNLQAVARGLIAERPEYRCWLLDLPHHGASGDGRHGDTVRGLAEDVTDWAASEGVAPTAILGHSYGGKVALAVAERGVPSLRQVWVIDSTPEARPASGGAWDMLAIVRSGPPRFATRDEAVELVVAGGFPLGVGQWMATNLERDDEGFVWRLDFDVMERLMTNFFETDLWGVVEHPPGDLEIHVLKASTSSVISAEAQRRLDAAGPRVHLHHRTGGHWIHAETPDVVVALLAEHLPR